MSDNITPDRPAGAGPTASADFRVEDMDCASCLETIRRKLDSQGGVVLVEGSPVARRLRVEFDPGLTDLESIRRSIGELGYRAFVHRAAARPRIVVWRTARALRTYSSGLLFVAGIALQIALDGRPDGAGPSWPSAAGWLFLGAAAVGGWNFFPKAVGAVRGRILDMHVLMTLAVVGAVAIGEYTEAGAIAFLFSLAELLENFAVQRANASVRSLMELSPQTATVRRDGREVTIRAADVRAGEEVIVRPGERVPVDGEIVDGHSALDESAITGEAMPIEKARGSPVYAGTIVHDGFLLVRSVRDAEETTLARMIALIEEAERRRSPSERFVERFARYYTPVVTAGAVLVALVPVLVFGESLSVWLLRGLTLLVIACPCALVISTPVSVVSAVTSAARNGVLIKGGHSLELMAEVRAMAFDKTGTLTHGRPEVAEVVPLDRLSEEEILGIAAAVESRSEHPLARAIVRAASARGLEPAGRLVSEFQALPGRGARGSVDGVSYTVGRPSLLDDHRNLESLPRLTAEGWTTVLLLREKRPGNAEHGGAIALGLLGLTDPVRPVARDVLDSLRALGVERLVILSGDHRAAAESLGLTVGADEVLARLDPEEKVLAVQALEKHWGVTAMVGDGVNDAPALAAASVGIALGAAASDVALETADIALMGDDLERLPYLYRLSRASRRVIRQNIAAAIVVKAVLAVGVPLGWVSLIVAVLVGDMGASLAVTANALRLARLTVQPSGAGSADTGFPGRGRGERTAVPTGS